MDYGLGNLRSKFLLCLYRIEVRCACQTDMSDSECPTGRNFASAK